MSANDKNHNTDFRSLQMTLARHLRDPEKYPAPPDIEDRRLQIYRGLLFNNVEGFLSNNFPVLRKFYANQTWLRLARSFYRDHQAHTPYFSEIGAEFVAYLSSAYSLEPTDPPFLAELAHYEYAETSLYTSLDPTIPANVDANLDPIEHQPYLTPLASVFSYRWPVHTISANCSPWQQPAQRTHLLLYRDRLDQVRFILVSTAIAELVELIAQHAENQRRVSGAGIVDQLIDRHNNYAQFREQALAEIHKLRERGIVIGAIAVDVS